MLSAHAVAAALLAASSSSSKSSGNALVSLLPLIVIFGLAYVFFLRPRSQAARRQRETLMELNAGDEVLTGAGIFGTVLDVEGDRVTIETAPGTRLTVLRSTIARKLNAEEEEEEETGWHDEEREGVGWEGDDHDPEHDHHDHDDYDPDHEHHEEPVSGEHPDDVSDGHHDASSGNGTEEGKPGSEGRKP